MTNLAGSSKFVDASAFVPILTHEPDAWQRTISKNWVRRPRLRGD